MRGDFFDTNILFYAASDDASKADVAERLISSGGTISSQVLNEFADSAFRKRLLDWAGVSEYLGGVRLVLDMRAVAEHTHILAVELAERFRLRLYDASIVASAMERDVDGYTLKTCTTASSSTAG